MTAEEWVCVGFGVLVAVVIGNPAGLAAGAVLWGLAQVLL